VSAEVRRATYAAAPGEIDAYPFGRGIAAVGRGAVVSGSDLTVIDAGPVAIYIALGWVAGSIYLAGIVAVLVQTVLGTRISASPAAFALLAATVANLAMLIFVNPMGVQAAILWMCAGYANALSAAARQQQPIALRFPARAPCSGVGVRR
jgi:hypothetical protein